MATPRRRRTKAELEKARRRRESARKANLMARHNMTVEQYDELLAYQDGHCYMCPARGVRRALQVDHDHALARMGYRCAHPADQSCEHCWRGLLCGTHNNMLGRAGRDKPVVFVRAAEYLLDPPAQRMRSDREGA